MNLKELFSAESARNSVIDLADKCKRLRLLKNEWKAYARANPGDPNPRVEHKDSDGHTQVLDLWAIQDKRETRSNCSRYHQLAYAFIRGVPYRAVEQTTKNPLSSYELAMVLGDHLTPQGKVEAGAKYRSSQLRYDVQDAVQAWLAEDPAHLQYLRLDAKVRKLFDRGLGDSEEADQIRDEMEVLWYTLGEERKGWLRRRLARIDRQWDKARARTRPEQKRGAA